MTLSTIHCHRALQHITDTLENKIYCLTGFDAVLHLEHLHKKGQITKLLHPTIAHATVTLYTLYIAHICLSWRCPS